MPLNIERGIKIGTKRNSEGKEGSHLKLVCEAHFKLISLNERAQLYTLAFAVAYFGWQRKDEFRCCPLLCGMRVGDWRHALCLNLF